MILTYQDKWSVIIEEQDMYIRVLYMDNSQSQNVIFTRVFHDFVILTRVFHVFYMYHPKIFEIHIRFNIL